MPIGARANAHVRTRRNETSERWASKGSGASRPLLPSFSQCHTKSLCFLIRRAQGPLELPGDNSCLFFSLSRAKVLSVRTSSLVHGRSFVVFVIFAISVPHAKHVRKRIGAYRKSKKPRRCSFAFPGHYSAGTRNRDPVDDFPDKPKDMQRRTYSHSSFAAFWRWWPALVAARGLGVAWVPALPMPLNEAHRQILKAR